jgi:hypothetical protein
VPENLGLARPEHCAEGSPARILRIPTWGRPAGRRPSGEILARPDPPDLAQPAAAKKPAQPGEGGRRPSRGLAADRPSRGKGRRKPSRGGGAGPATAQDPAREPSQETYPAEAGGASAHAEEGESRPTLGF